MHLSNYECECRDRRAPNTRLVCVGYVSRRLSSNFVNIKFACLDTTPLKRDNVENSLKIFVINLPY